MKLSEHGGTAKSSILDLYFPLPSSHGGIPIYGNPPCNYGYTTRNNIMDNVPLFDISLV